MSDYAKKNILLETIDSEPNVLDELVNLKSQFMDIIEYSTAFTSILEQETVVNSDCDVENSELSSESDW